MAQECCPKTFTGFCLSDGTPIGITIDNGAIISWVDLTTGTVTPGSPPAGTVTCDENVFVNVDFDPLTCETDSVTVCPPDTGTFDVEVVNEVNVAVTGVVDVDVVTQDLDIRDLDCSTDSITVCPPATGIFDVEVVNDLAITGVVDTRQLDCETDFVTVCPPATGVFEVEIVNDVAVTGVVDTRQLDCTTDSITVCSDALTDVELRASPVPISLAAEGNDISVVNSTTTPLGAGATFTGAFVDVLPYADIAITVFADEDSAVDGLVIEASTDGINVDSSDEYTIFANAGKVFSSGAQPAFVRVRYTNGATPQTEFRLQTVLKRFRGKPSSHRIQDDIIEEDDAELVKAIISGKKPDGTFTNFSSTAGGNFKVSLEEADPDFFIPRPSETNNRNHINAIVDAGSADTTVFTPTAAHTAYLTSVSLTIVNSSVVTQGRIVLRDGGAAGPIKAAYLVATAPAVGESRTEVAALTFDPEPLQFATDVFVDVISGTLTYSLTIVGYEES